MNYGKYDTFVAKTVLICNELSCIDQEDQLLLIKNTMNFNGCRVVIIFIAFVIISNHFP